MAEQAFVSLETCNRLIMSTAIHGRQQGFLFDDKNGKP